MSFFLNNFGFVCLFSLVFPFVINIDGVVFDEQDFYSKYSKAEWVKSNDSQKKRILEDYVKRESAALDATSRGFLYDPVLLKKLRVKKNQLLVSSAYDLLVAYPLIDRGVLSLGKKNLKKDVFLKHLVIGHSESSLSVSSKISKEDAYLFVGALKDSLELGVERFSSFAEKYSNDPSALNNGGVIGWLQWGQTPMPFQEKVWDLSPGSLSSIIETEYGYHLVVVDSIRSSEFAEYDTSSYNNVVFMRSLFTVKDLLKKASSDFDYSLFEDGNLHIFDSEVGRLFDLMESEKLLLAETSERFDFFGFLGSLEARFVLCRFDDKLYGLRWILDSIGQIPPSRIPAFSNKDEFVVFLKNFFLQKFAINYSLNNGVDLSLFFTKRLGVEKSRLLYDSLLKHLVNSIESPDSGGVLSYYNKHKESKYSNPEKVVIRQIKLNSRALADSLFGVIEKDPSLFVFMAKNYSINRKSTGGLMEPFERGKYNFLGEAAFSLDVGGVAGPIENPDKTFSIILLEEKLAATPIPLKRVYKRIESFLIKESQEKIKKETFDGYLLNPGLTFGEKYEKYFN